MPFVELQSVDSTNNYAHAQLKNGSARHGMAFFAHEQLEGKGQRGRKWLSEKGSNIILTILLDPRPVRLSEQFQLNAMIAVTLREFFSKYAGEETKIKWPNDLYWQDRKAGGVLVESIVGSRESKIENGSAEIENGQLANTSDKHGTWKWAIVGIGININQTVFSEELKNPVSLKQITGKDFNVIELAKELSDCVLQNFRLLVENGFGHFFESYNTRLYKKNEKVKLKKDNRLFDAVIRSVSKTGQLIIDSDIEEEFEFGEIEWVK